MLFTPDQDPKVLNIVIPLGLIHHHSSMQHVILKFIRWFYYLLLRISYKSHNIRSRNETKLGKLRMCSVHDVRRKTFSNAGPMQISVPQSAHAFIVKRRHVSTIWEAEHLNLLSHSSSTHPKATIRGSGSILCVRSVHNHGETCFAGIFRHRSFTLNFFVSRCSTRQTITLNTLERWVFTWCLAAALSITIIFGRW